MSSPNSDEPSRVPVEPLWLTRFYKDDEFEKQYNTHLAIKLAPLELREILWNYSQDLIGDQRAKGGVTGQACHIFERYCAHIVWKYKNLTLGEWKVKKIELKRRASLLLLASLMLASKMETTQAFITGSSLRRALQKSGRSYTLQEINVAELEVFTAIGFRIPLWSNVQKVQMLVVELGLPECVMLSSAILMDLVELQLPLVYGRLKMNGVESMSPATSRSESGPSESSREREFHLSSIHLVAGVVLASIRFIALPGPDFTPIVARWCRTTVGYVSCLGAVIFEYLIETFTERMRQCHLETESTPRTGYDARRHQAKRRRHN